jgi:hypothetical protein
MRSLDPERRAKVAGAIELVAARGPTLGRPHVDTLHGSRVAKLKELRIDRGARVLFAFDSHRRAVMLVGGDKTGAWQRWYPPMIRTAENALAAHERRQGREPPWRTRHPPGRSR